MYYAAFGLVFDSELPLGIVPETTVKPDIHIRTRTLPLVPFIVLDEWNHRLHVGSGEVFLKWDDVAVFRVRADEITIDAQPNVPDEVLRLFLLGPVMGVLLEKRGYLTLHASCLAVGDSALAFLGRKGQGKSSLGAAFVKAGHTMITDDILAVDTSLAGIPMATPGFPQLRLWPDTIAALGEDLETLRPLLPGEEKLGYSTTNSFQRSSLPLRNVVFLEYGRDETLDHLRGASKLTQLLSQSYGYRFLGTSHLGSSDFVRWAQLASHVRAYRLIRPADISSLSSHVNLIVETILGEGCT